MVCAGIGGKEQGGARISTTDGRGNRGEREGTGLGKACIRCVIGSQNFFFLSLFYDLCPTPLLITQIIFLSHILFKTGETKLGLILWKLELSSIFQSRRGEGRSKVVHDAEDTSLIQGTIPCRLGPAHPNKNVHQLWLSLSSSVIFKYQKSVS